MTKRICLSISVLCLMSASFACFAIAPVVSNVRASQRADGSKIVDIYYDLADTDTEKLKVSFVASSTGGEPYNIALASVSGDVGNNVPRGTDKHIVWNAGTDLFGAYGTNYKVSVVAADSLYTGEMIIIPAGTFLMRNSNVDNDTVYYSSSELPQHTVTLADFYIGKYEVTRGEYRAFLMATGRAQPAYWDAVQDWGTGSFTQTDNHPVVGVKWYDAEAFCSWAGGHLPTEAQWEKVARWTGSYPNVYPWGNTSNVKKFNSYDDTYFAGGGYGKYQTATVGSYPGGASPYGCQDMTGNVWKWCQDWYKSYPDSISPFDYTNSYRVLRSGGWDINGDYIARCALRTGSVPSFSYFGYGFRLAC